MYLQILSRGEGEGRLHTIKSRRPRCLLSKINAGEIRKILFLSYFFFLHNHWLRAQRKRRQTIRYYLFFSRKKKTVNDLIFDLLYVYFVHVLQIHRETCLSFSVALSPSQNRNYFCFLFGIWKLYVFSCLVHCGP